MAHGLADDTSDVGETRETQSFTQTEHGHLLNEINDNLKLLVLYASEIIGRKLEL